MTFEQLELIEPIQKALTKEGYTIPTPIQAEAIPYVLDGYDLLGCAQTGTGKTAAALSEIIGKYDHTKVEASQGTARGFFRILPHDRHEDVRFSTENRYRVMPEEITGLYPGQAIVFDASTDQIIYFN